MIIDFDQLFAAARAMPHHPDCFIRPTGGMGCCLDWRSERALDVLGAINITVEGVRP